MVFSSITFLFYFFPATLIAYLVSPSQLRNLVLVVASLVFYIWGAGSLIIALIASIPVNYVAGLAIEHVRKRSPGAIRILIGLSVTFNIGLLAYYKYAAFLADTVAHLVPWFNFPEATFKGIVLPLGISFFTFHSISYVLDVARGRCAPMRNLIDFCLYIVLFPQLIAGPIVRFNTIEGQIRHRITTFDDIAIGCLRFAHGLLKKVALADPCGMIVNLGSSIPASDHTTASAWLITAAYTFQIYFDFSGYSDMAIGIARMFGFRLPENFRRPYSSASITEFWRRWHMSLSGWLRDYLYIPLGGSRRSNCKTMFNLWTVFLLCGLWHGANWTFVVWGAYHGALLSLEKVFGIGTTERHRFVVTRRALVMVLVMFGWVIFHAPSLSDAAQLLNSMLIRVTPGMPLMLLDQLTPHNIAFLAVASLSAFMPGEWSVGQILQREAPFPARHVTVITVLLVLIAYPYALMRVVAGTYSPFIYFQF